MLTSLLGYYHYYLKVVENLYGGENKWWKSSTDVEVYPEIAIDDSKKTNSLYSAYFFDH